MRMVGTVGIVVLTTVIVSGIVPWRRVEEVSVVKRGQQMTPEKEKGQKSVKFGGQIKERPSRVVADDGSRRLSVKTLPLIAGKEGVRGDFVGSLDRCGKRSSDSGKGEWGQKRLNICSPKRPGEVIIQVHVKTHTWVTPPTSHPPPVLASLPDHVNSNPLLTTRSRPWAPTSRVKGHWSGPRHHHVN